MNYIEQYKMAPDICDDLISYFKENTEYKSPGVVGVKEIKYEIKKSIDVCFFNNSNDQRIKNFFIALGECVRPYCKKYNLKHGIKTEIDNNIQYYKAGEGYFANHYERDSISSSTRELAYMVYLNTLTDKGGTFFPRHKKTIEPIKGKTVLWPASFTHPHRGVISSTQEKYIATGWFVIV
jgi:prolyl 4-hydroxylase